MQCNNNPYNLHRSTYRISNVKSRKALWIHRKVLLLVASIAKYSQDDKPAHMASANGDAALLWSVR